MVFNRMLIPFVGVKKKWEIRITNHRILLGMVVIVVVVVGGWDSSGCDSGGYDSGGWDSGGGCDSGGCGLLNIHKSEV